MPLSSGTYAMLGKLGLEFRRAETRRLVGEVPLSYRHINIVNQSLQQNLESGDVMELGMKGLRLAAGGDVKSGDWLEVSLQLPGHVVPVVVAAEVIHVGRLPGFGARKLAGVKILEMSGNDSQRLNAFLERVSRGKTGNS